MQIEYPGHLHSFVYKFFSELNFFSLKKVEYLEIGKGKKIIIIEKKEEIKNKSYYYELIFIFGAFCKSFSINTCQFKIL